LGCPHLDLIRTGFFFESVPASGFGLLKLREMDLELVLHRPIETTGLTDKFSTGPSILANRLAAR
jgi:hypothetical protein